MWRGCLRSSECFVKVLWNSDAILKYGNWTSEILWNFPYYGRLFASEKLWVGLIICRTMENWWFRFPKKMWTPLYFFVSMIVVHSFPISFYDIRTKWAPQNDSEVGEQFSNFTMVYGTQIAIVISWSLETTLQRLGAPHWKNMHTILWIPLCLTIY